MTSGTQQTFTAELARAIGERMRARRLHRGETQAVFGARFGVTKVTVCRWERGASLPPGDVIVAVAHDCNFDLADLPSPSGRREVPPVELGTPLHTDGVEMPPTGGTFS